jgi:hypothetical protein
MIPPLILFFQAAPPARLIVLFWRLSRFYNFGRHGVSAWLRQPLIIKEGILSGHLHPFN